MGRNLRRDAQIIIEKAINNVLPYEAVTKILNGRKFQRKVFLVAIGKASWEMANAASKCLRNVLTAGIVITKYGHSKGDIFKTEIHEAGHPIPDENSYKATKKALGLVAGLSDKDTVIFLVSGGGSALFEYPLIPLTELNNITDQLLKTGADIIEINTVRKRLSAVKGGKFARACVPAKVLTIILSDILGNPVDMIASGPACEDSSSCGDAESILEKYNIETSLEVKVLMNKEPIKNLTNVETHIIGSVRELCRAAENACRDMGYETYYLTDRLCCEARDAGSMLGSIAVSHQHSDNPAAFIFGGETLVHVTGTGKGGRNQEIALAAAKQIDGIENVLVFSVGSDGTDGPTDAAGGICDGRTAGTLRAKGLNIDEVLKNNDAYNALKAADNLIITGPTGTNVNDLSVVLVAGKTERS